MLALFLAAASKPSVWEKLRAVPTDTWTNLLITAVFIVVMVWAWKKLAEFNEFAPWIVLVMLGGSIVLYWTYERTEPKVLSPVFDVLAEYLPSRIQYKDAPTP